MKHLLLNLKRFDITPERGGVNRIAPPARWGEAIVGGAQERLSAFAGHDAEFVMFFPEAHLITAAAARTSGSPVQLGSQGVYRADTAPGGNFGAFTTNLTANAAAQLGCGWALIGHCEERADKLDILARAGVAGGEAAAVVNKLLNEEVLRAQEAGMRVAYCIGEKSEEQDRWQEVLGAQLEEGLAGADLTRVVAAYEPVWSIGPGKTPADAPYIAKIARFIKSRLPVDVVYGGGLRADNAGMLAGIPEIDGGLIALTRFAGEIGFYPEEYIEIIRLYLERG